MKVSNLLSALVAHNVSQAAIVHSLWPVFRVPDEFVDKIAEMQDEIETFTLGSMLIVEDHSAIGVLRSLADILATDKRKPNRPVVIKCWSGAGSADAASITLRIHEAIPIDTRRFQATDKHAARPIGIARY